MKRPSSYDVAREAGVSQATVSMVLTNRAGARIPEETRQRVLAAAAAVGYVASSAARALATGRTRRIGFVPFNPKQVVADRYFHRVLDGMIDGAAAASYGLLLHTAAFGSVDELQADVLGGGADAVVLLGRPVGDTLAERLHRSGFRTICAAFDPGIPEVPVVDVDKRMSGRLAGERLMEAGHRQVAYVTGGVDNSWTQHFLGGFEEAFGEPVEGRGLVTHFDTETLLSAVEQGFTAIYLTHEGWAEDFLLTCRRVGLRVPEDVTILTDWHQDEEGREQTISGVREPVTGVGLAAVQAAIACTEGQPYPPIQRLPVAWVAGTTFGPARIA